MGNYEMQDSNVRLFPKSLHRSLSAMLPVQAEKQILSEIAARPPSRPLRLVRAVPVKTLPVSVTGGECVMKCAHCQGHYLGGMKPLSALTPADLESCTSLLLSGGGTASGEVPLAEHLDAILRLPASLSLNLHVGLQDGHLLESLRDRRVTVSFDLIGDDATVRDVFGLDRSAAEYFDAYEAIGQRFPVIPHLTIGLRAGKLSGEKKVIDYLSERPPRALTFLVFRPTPGTRFSGCTPPPIGEIVGLIREAAERLGCPIHLGCMRPSGLFRRRLDILAWAAGARTIVMPDRALLDALSESGIPIQDRSECCSLQEGSNDAS